MNINFNYYATIQDIDEEYLSKIGKVMTFCNGIIYYGTPCTIIFDLVTLTLKFDLLLKNFNLGHNFLTRSDGAFILHMCIPCDKTFLLVK